jgi:hypothetical protein
MTQVGQEKLSNPSGALDQIGPADQNFWSGGPDQFFLIGGLKLVHRASRPLDDSNSPGRETVVQVGPAVHNFLDRRAGTFSFNRGSMLDHRATVATGALPRGAFDAHKRPTDSYFRQNILQKASDDAKVELITRAD